MYEAGAFAVVGERLAQLRLSLAQQMHWPIWRLPTWVCRGLIEISCKLASRMHVRRRAVLPQQERTRKEGCMNRRSFLQKATLGTGSALAAGALAKASVLQTTSSGGIMTGKEELDRAQSLRDLNALLDKPEVRKALATLDTASAKENPDFPCKTCCLLGGGGNHP